MADRTVFYCNPFVPVEWMVAHGVTVRWLRIRSVSGTSGVGPRQGHCPLAAAVVEAVSSASTDAATVLTTTCDQMRHSGSFLRNGGQDRIFLMNVPSTWQTPAARQLYLDELLRLGRFLIRQGGRSPSKEELREVMGRFDRKRANLRQARPSMAASDWSLSLMAVRESPSQVESDSGMVIDPVLHGDPADSTASIHAPKGAPQGVPLALIGGPLLDQDRGLLDRVEFAGGRFVLDATEWGERTLPRPFDEMRAGEDPLTELVDAYFGTIPDVFRRPNDPFDAYLKREFVSRKVRGVVVVRYPWCDLWHAEVARWKAFLDIPLLDLDRTVDEELSVGRARGRVESFLEVIGR